MTAQHELMDSKRGLYLAVFYSSKTSPKWRA